MKPQSKQIQKILNELNINKTYSWETTKQQQKLKSEVSLGQKSRIGWHI